MNSMDSQPSDIVSPSATPEIEQADTIQGVDFVQFHQRETERRQTFKNIMKDEEQRVSCKYSIFKFFC